VRKETKYVIALILLGLAFVGALSWAIYESIPKLHNHATIRVIGVEIYEDANLTTSLNVIEWGLLDPGENRSYSCWIKNIGNDAQKLTTWTEAWNPANASDWITLTWNYNNTWIPAEGSISVDFIISVRSDFDPDITNFTEFSFDIWVKGVH